MNTCQAATQRLSDEMLAAIRDEMTREERIRVIDKLIAAIMDANIVGDTEALDTLMFATECACIVDQQLYESEVAR